MRQCQKILSEYISQAAICETIMPLEKAQLAFLRKVTNLRNRIKQELAR